VPAGQHEQALGLLERAHNKADYTASGWQRINPEWAPLHGNPRFEKLIAEN
jgi:hypothetical protein